MTSYSRLPEPPTAYVGESLANYGTRLLMFVVCHQVTATMSDRELELAEHFAPMALWGRGRDGTDLLVVERIRDARTLIAAAVKGRLKLAESSQPPAAGAGSPSVQPPEGPMAKLRHSPDNNPQPPVTHATADDVLEALRQKAGWHDKPKVDIRF